MTSGAPTQAAIADSRLGVPGADITVREVPWHHLAAVALREALAGEMLLRATEPFPGHGGLAAVFGADAATVAYTGVAFTGEGLPAGYAALRWAGDHDVELAGLYVVPSHRTSGASSLLLAAAEAAARGLRGNRSADDGEVAAAGPRGSQPADDEPTGEKAARMRARRTLPALPLATARAAAREGQA
jgi:GNAT superfamily N-acetyltransferase